MVYGAVDKAVDALALGFGVGLDGVFLAFGDGQVDAVIGFSDPLILCFCCAFDTGIYFPPLVGSAGNSGLSSQYGYIIAQLSILRNDKTAQISLRNIVWSAN